MTMRLLTTIFLLFSVTAQASYIERCQFMANVATIHHNVQKLDQTINDGGKTIVAFKVASLISSVGSHDPDACQSRLGSIQLLEVASDFSYQQGETLIVEYFHVSGRGPNGMVQSNTWSLK